LADEAAVRAVVAEITAMPVPAAADPVSGGDPVAGAAHYRSCQACHGSAAEGLKAQRTPPLAGQHGWYLVAQTTAFKAAIRGSHPEDSEGLTMTGMSAVLPDEQAIRDVCAYITSLRE
jgi:cytochrome c oxidase subunit 2